MAVQKIKGTATGSWNNWGVSGGTKMDAIDPDNATAFSSLFLYMNVISTWYQSFVITPPAARTSITSWVTYTCNGKNANRAQVTYGMYDFAVGWRSSHYYEPDVFIWNCHGASHAWASPTDAQVDAATLQIAIINSDGDGTHPCYCNYLYADFTYVPADMSFLAIWNLILPVIGAGLALKDMPRVNAWLMRNTNFRFEQHEYEEAYKQIKNYKFPTYFNVERGLWIPKVA